METWKNEKNSCPRDCGRKKDPTPTKKCVPESSPAAPPASLCSHYGRKSKKLSHQVAYYPHAISMDSANFGDLTNDIHPIFNRHNFHGPSFYEWPAFEMQLRMVSRLIESPSGLKYFFAMFFGVNEQLTGEEDVRGRTLEGYSGKKTDLTAADVAATKLKLHSMAGMVKFQIDDDSMLSAGHTKHLTRRPSWYDGDIQAPGGELTGWCSIVSIGTKIYEPCIRPSPEYKHPEVRVMCQFMFAIVLLHELSHAVGHAVQGNGHEDHLDGCNVAEYGFEITACLLGAIPAEINQTPNPLLTLVPWPDRSICTQYASRTPAILLPIRKPEALSEYVGT